MRSSGSNPIPLVVKVLKVNNYYTTNVSKISAACRENLLFENAITNAKISCAEAAQLTSAFGFDTPIIQCFYFLKPKFQASSHLLCVYSLDCVGPDRIG